MAQLRQVPQARQTGICHAGITQRKRRQPIKVLNAPKWRGSAKIFDEPNEQRLELGLIRFGYFTSKDGTIDWDAVIESIRR
jgi:hypothetical protein